MFMILMSTMLDPFVHRRRCRVEVAYSWMHWALLLSSVRALTLRTVPSRVTEWQEIIRGGGTRLGEEGYMQRKHM